MKKLISAALSAILVFSLMAFRAAPAAGAAFEEGGLSDWAIESYQKANDYGILNWFLRNEDYTVPITRAEFCDMVFNTVCALRNGITADIDMGLPMPFTDTDRDSVYCLAQLGIAEGIGEKRFDPDGTLTREQAATFMSRAGKILDFTFLPENGTEFTDAVDIADWAAEAAETMRQSGLMIGTDTGEFLPRSLLTREQAVAVLVRFLEKNGFNYGIYIRDVDRVLTLEDLRGLNGKYRAIGEDSYEITCCQGNFATLVVTVTGEDITGAELTYLNTGEKADLLTQRMDDLPFTMAYAGRSFLGGSAYTVETDDRISLELNGAAVLSLSTYEYGTLNYQRLGGKLMAYATKGDKTAFFSLPDGELIFTVEGYVHRITNRYIITAHTRYSAPTADSAYELFSVYTHDWTKLDTQGLSEAQLYQLGYITDN